MSLAIDVNKVVMVQLADGWHPVIGNSFEFDAYEYGYYAENDSWQILHGGGRNGICATGFRFKTTLNIALEQYPFFWMCGPLTSIVAVAHEE